MFAGHAIVGFSLSITVTAKEQVAVLPAASVIIKVLVVVPMGNVAPEAMPAVWVMVGPAQLSEEEPESNHGTTLRDLDADVGRAGDDRNLVIHDGHGEGTGSGVASGIGDNKGVGGGSDREGSAGGYACGLGRYVLDSCRN